MFKRIRQLKISLAAKCQLLFGVAVVLIITAALSVPWYRTEQLTEQLDPRAARTLAEDVLQDHVTRQRQGLPDDAIPRASGDLDTPRLIGLSSSARLTQFEARSLARLQQQPNADYTAKYYDRKDGSRGYRYAMALYPSAREDCRECHSPAVAASVSASTSGAAATRVAVGARAATMPATAPGVPAGAGMLGIVAVDINSQIETGQRMLNRVVFLAAGMLAGALAIIVFYLITTRLILQPVRVLQETAERVSEGDLNIRSDINTGDEFQQLSETFNTMLANLKGSDEQLRAINKGLDLKLGQMAETNVALYESNRLKSEFLANVSHELRTPLNSILGFADLLKDTIGPDMDAKAQRYVQNILGSGNNLLSLINDLLDLAKIEAGKMEVRSEPLTLPDLFEGLSNLLKPLLEQKGLAVVARVESDVPIIRTDVARLRQVLFNLLSNAIKFSPAQGRIFLSAAMDGEMVRVAVADQGPGIEPEKQKLIFEKFRQVDQSVTREHSGTGLGLAISRELVTLLGGQIGVESEPGHGATFWIRLPLQVTAGMADIRGKLVLTS